MLPEIVTLKTTTTEITRKITTEAVTPKATRSNLTTGTIRRIITLTLVRITRTIITLPNQHIATIGITLTIAINNKVKVKNPKVLAASVPSNFCKRLRIRQRERTNVFNRLFPLWFASREIVNFELMQHEHGHAWPFTVIAPVKEFGNIPGFKDCSPEEVRYQYYEAVSKNTLFEFVSTYFDERTYTRTRTEYIPS
jgi:hypothetical protein